MASAPMFGLAQFGQQFCQLPPPSALRQTPPAAAPAHSRRGSAGCAISVVTRPAMLNGPRHAHSGSLAGEDDSRRFQKSSRSPAWTSCSVCDPRCANHALWRLNVEKSSLIISFLHLRKLKSMRHSIQRRDAENAEISAENTNARTRSTEGEDAQGSPLVFSALPLRSLRLCVEKTCPSGPHFTPRDRHPHHFMPNLSKYQSSVRSRRTSISRRRNEISPSTRSAMASPKASCLCSARIALARRGGERWANASRNRLCRY